MLVSMAGFEPALYAPSTHPLYRLEYMDMVPEAGFEPAKDAGFEPAGFTVCLHGQVLGKMMTYPL